MQALAELVETGMRLARDAAQQALEPPQTTSLVGSTPGAPPEDPVLRFCRISRAVRIAIALQSRIAEAAPAEDEPPPPAITPFRKLWEEARASRLAARRATATLPVLKHRREHRDPGADWGRRPLTDIVSDICRDLRLRPDFSCWVDREHAMMPPGPKHRPPHRPKTEARAANRPAPPGSPPAPGCPPPDRPANYIPPDCD